MLPDSQLLDRGLLIVTGSTLRAERADRPLAYQLRNHILERNGWHEMPEESRNIVVINDLWYLNCEPLHTVPTISVGGPGVNAVSAYLLDRLPRLLQVDDSILIQMDPEFSDKRVSIWGQNHALTVDALNLFIEKGFLERFLSGAVEIRTV